MEGTFQRTEGATDSSSFCSGWSRPLSGERSPTRKLSSQPSPLTYAYQQAKRAEESQGDVDPDVKGLQRTTRVNLSTEDKLIQNRARSCTPHQSLPGTMYPRTSEWPLSSSIPQAGLNCGTSLVRLVDADESLQEASSQQSPGTNAAALTASRPHVACRFSYEDYKHTQFVEWLEREMP